MTDYAYDRINTLPKRIVDLSIADAEIAAAVHRFGESDQTVESFLEDLVLQLADGRRRDALYIQRCLQSGIVWVTV